MKKLNVGYLFLALMFVAVAFNDAEGKKYPLEDARKNMQSLRKACAPKSGASKELLDNAAKGDMPPDRKLQCYQKCLLEMVKAMKDDKLRPQVMTQQADLMLIPEHAARVKAAVTECYPSVTSTDGCEAAWQFVTCYYAKDSEAYMFP